MKKIFLVLFLCSTFSTMAKEVEEKNDVKLIIEKANEKAEFDETSEDCWVVNWSCTSSIWCQMDTTLEESIELIKDLEKEFCG